MNISQRTLVFALAIGALAAPILAEARQLGNGGTTYSSLMARTRPEEFLGRFIEVAQADLAANTALLNALQAPEATRPSSSALASLDMKASTADISNATSAAATLHKLATQTVAAHAPLNEADKANFASAALGLSLVARNITDLTKNIAGTKQALAAAGAPARVALYAARNTSDLAEQLRAEVKAVVAFASANQIALAPEVIEAAAAM
jgi:hypothetical protein